jgi:hypothetical protein
MENIKLTPIHLDKDTEERLLPANAMSEAFNVRTMSGKTGGLYVLKNIPSTENMIVRPTQQMVSEGKTQFDWSGFGEVEAIGSAVNVDLSELFVAMFSSTNKHLILRYSTYDDVWDVVMISGLLNFSRNSFASMAAVTLDGFSLLYLTDNNNDPIKINVDLAVRATMNGVFPSGADDDIFNELNDFNHFFRQIKVPPTNKPSVEVYTDDTKTYNNILKGAYQFAFNYVHKNFEPTTYSPFSDVAISLQSLNQVVANSLQPRAEWNAIRVKGAYGGADVEEINIIARDRNNGDWFLVETIENIPNGGEWEINFFNNGVYAGVDQSEVNNPFHAVPKRSRALAVNSDRVFHANYVEGFNLDANISPSVSVNYLPRPDVEELELEVIQPTRRFGNNVDSLVFSQTASPDALRIDCSNQLNNGDNIIVSFFFKNILVWGYETISGGLREQFRGSIPTVVLTTTRSSSAGTLVQQLQSSLNQALSDLDVTFNNAGVSSGILSPQRNNFTVKFLDLYRVDIQSTDLVLTRRAPISKSTAKTIINPIGGSWNGSTGEDRAANAVRNYSSGFFIEQGVADPVANSTTGIYITPLFRIIPRTIGQASQSFKRGAFHEFGILYQDFAGRNGGVIKNEDALRQEVKWYSSEQDGAVSIDWKIQGTPPSWATHYKWVYSGNQSVDEFLQYQAIDVHRARRGFNAGTGNTDASVVSSDRSIYVNLRGLQGKSDSYIESFGALFNYNFVEGDRVRIVSYIDPSTGDRVMGNPSLDFKVLGKEFYNATEDGSNPVYNTASDFTKYNTSGWFLIVEDPQIDGWNYESINNKEKNLWVNKNDTPEPDFDFVKQGAIFEIYRPKSQTEQVVFTEASDTYAIEGGKHKGQFRNEGEDVQGTYASVPLRNNLVLSDLGSGIIVGDEVLLDSGTGLSVIAFVEQISTATQNNQTISVIKFNVNVPQSLNGTITLLSKTAAGTFNCGDVYFKPRLLRNNREQNTFDFNVDFVEDYKHSDFLNNQSTNKGREQFFIKGERERRRRASLIHSETLLQEDNSNGLSSYNLQNNIFRDYNISGGSIQLIANLSDDLIAYQESKVFRINVSKNIIQSADGAGTLTLNRDILSDAQYYKGEYGIGIHPQTFVDNDGIHFFFDLKRAAVLRLGGDGLFVISDIDNKTFFNELSDSYLKTYRSIKLIAGLDRENREYNLSLPPITLRRLEIGGQPIGNALNITDAGANIVINDITVKYVNNPPIITIGQEQRIIEDICQTWADWGQNIIFLDELSKNNEVSIDASLAPQPTQTIGGGTVFPNVSIAVAIIISPQIVLSGVLNTATGTIVLPKDQSLCSAGQLSIEQDGAFALDGITIVYNIDAQKWQGTRAYNPDLYAHIANYMFGFNANTIARHETGLDYNNFYGVQYNSSLTTSLNAEPSLVKTAHAMSLESDRGLDVEISTNLNGTSFATSHFEKKEGFVYANLPYAKTNSTDNHIVGLGSISAIDVTETTVTITGLNTSLPNITRGAEVYFDGTLIGTIDEIVSKNQIKLSSVSGINVGDFLYILYPVSTYGDNIRGYSFVVKCTLSVSPEEEFTLHGINMKINESKNSH